MKFLFGATVLLFLTLFPAWAEGPDDQYVGIYNLIQQGDALNEGGQAATALARYAEAQTLLTRFQRNYPDWNVKVVTYRLGYLSDKIAELTPKVRPAIAATNQPTPVSATPPVQPEIQPAVTVPTPPPNNADLQIRTLQEQVRQLQGEKADLESSKTLLESKLKEAFSIRPSATDPRELARAQDQARELLKQNELLRVSLNQARSNQVRTDPAALEKSRQSLAEADQKLAQLAQANTALAAEKEALLARVNAPAQTDPAAAALRAENEILKKQVADLKQRGGAATPATELTRKLNEAQSQLAALQSDKEILRLEKAALEGRVRQLSEAPVVPATAANDTSAEKIRQLEAEKIELQRNLDAALQELTAHKKDEAATARVQSMTRDMEGLRARIDIYEAKRVPYTAEELALIDVPKPTVLMASAHASARNSTRNSATNSATLLAEAQKHYAANELDQAEQKYIELVKADPKNVTALTDLATVQTSLNHTADAEKSLSAAMALEPENTYPLSVMGMLKFQQGKFDEALDSLSRAAQLKPEDAKIQNSLGIVLSEKGLRVPAENALLKAIRINPEYGSAHANLAFIYVTQTPPLLELARWHYQKALAAGIAPNPKIEKLLGADKPVEAAK